MDKSLKFFLKRPYLAIFVTSVLFVLASLPNDSAKEFSAPNDKLNHLLAFAVLTIVWFQTFLPKKWIIVGLILFGVFIELWQSQLPDYFRRSAEIADVIADIFGILIGIFIFFIFTRIKIKI